MSVQSVLTLAFALIENYNAKPRSSPALLALLFIVATYALLVRPSLQLFSLVVLHNMHAHGTPSIYM